MSSGKVKCTCGWSWNKSDSSKKDMYICHECGRDNSNNMKNGGWLDNYNDSEVSLPEGYVGEGYNTKGRDYSPAWGGQFEDGGELTPIAQNGTRADSLFLLKNNKIIKNLEKSGYKWTGKKDSHNNKVLWKQEYDFLEKNLPKLIANDKKKKQKTKPSSTYIDKRNKLLGTQDWLELGNEDYFMPKQYIHPDIVPQFSGDLKKENKDRVHSIYSYGYDDLAITPFDMLTPEQKKLRVQKYGTDGVPKSYLDKLKPTTTKATTKPIYVESKNDPRYEAYQDSLSLYKRGIEKVKYWRNNPDATNGELNIKEDEIDRMFPVSKSRGSFGDKRIDAFGSERIGSGPSERTVFHYEKPQEPVIVKPRVQPKVKGLNLQPIEQAPINIPIQELDFNTPIKAPKSYNVNMQRYNMQGPSDYYQANEEGVDYQRAMQIKAASDAYNKSIEEKYGPQNEYRTPKSAADAAERLKQLRSEFEVTPNYQMGGSIPGAVGFTYARTQSPAPSNGPYAKKTKASAQKGKNIPKLDISQLDLTIPKSTGYAWADDIVKKNKKGLEKVKEIKTKVDNEQIAAIKKQYKVDDATAKKWYDNSKNLKQEQAEIRPYTPQSTLSKTWDVITNPMTAFGYVARNQDLPDNFTSGERNNLDMAIDVINPAAWANYAGHGVKDLSNVPGQLMEGDFTGAGNSTLSGAVNLLGAIPLAQELKPFASSALKTLPKVKTFTKGVASDIKFTADQIGQLNNQIKTTRPYVDQSLAHINDVRRIPEHMNTVVTRDDLIHQLNYLQDDLRSTYQSASSYRATPEQINKAVGKWQKDIIDKIGGIESLSSVNPAMSDPAHIQNLYNNILDNLVNAKEIEKFGVSALKTARREQIFNPSIDIEKIKTFAKNIGKKSDDLSEITIAPKEQETINAVRELGKYRKMIASDMNDALSHPKTLQNLNQLILKLDDDVVQSIVGIPKAELLNRYKNMVPLDIREGVKDIISNPISTNELRSVPSQYTAIDPAIEKLNTGYSNSSLFSKLGKRYYEINSPYNIETITGLPESMISFARTDKYLKPKYDWENNFIGYEDDVFTTGNTSGQLRDALKKVEAAPKGRNFVGSSSLSTDSFPLTLESGMFMTKKGMIEPKFSGELIPLNPMGTTNQLPNLSLKEINFKIQELEKLSGKKIPRAKLVDGEYKVPEIYFTRLREGGVIKDDMGQWAHPGEITEIGSNQITMEGVPYPVLGISDTGDIKLMKPGKNYKFKGKKVTEYPMAKNGLRQEQKGLVNLDQLTNFTNYNTKQPGGWLDKY